MLEALGQSRLPAYGSHVTHSTLGGAMYLYSPVTTQRQPEKAVSMNYDMFRASRISVAWHEGNVDTSRTMEFEDVTKLHSVRGASGIG